MTVAELIEILKKMPQDAGVDVQVTFEERYEVGRVTLLGKKERTVVLSE